ncbi:MAG: diphthine--ammonia ligase [Nanoarchaeota archaeon]
MVRKCGVLFSGGKDSTYSAYLAKKAGYELTCLITIISKNPDSYMFHTPSIDKTKKQAEVMGLPLIVGKTKGEKEKELEDLEKTIKKAKAKYKFDFLVTGAIKSDYQKSRIGGICKKLKIECYNPLWEKDELEYLHELIRNDFKIVITGVAAHPLDKRWLGREVNQKFVEDVIELQNKYQIHPAGEGGEFETFVLYCPLFKNELRIKNQKISGEKNSWRMDIEVE